MDQWTWPAYVGVILGLVLFALVFVPTLFVQMRRYGALSLQRLVGAGALAVYVVALGAYTLLPLPSGDLVEWCAQHGLSGAQLRPFQFIEDIRRDAGGLGLGAMLISRAVLQVVFNVVLFFPLGVFVRRYLGRSVGVATLAGFVVSLFIELTQHTGIWGLIGCSYRLGDIDDLMANTLGALLGAWVAPVILFWMPQSRELSARRLQPRPVTVWRRWAGMAIDAFSFVAVRAVVMTLFRLYRFGVGESLTLDDWQWSEWIIGWGLAWVLVFGIPPFLGSGASWGQRAVWLAPVASEPNKGSRFRFVMRAWCVGGAWGALQGAQSIHGLPAGWVDLWSGLGDLLPLVAIVAVIVTRDRRGLSGLLSRTRFVDSRSRSHPRSRNVQEDGDSWPPTRAQV